MLRVQWYMLFKQNVRNLNLLSFVSSLRMMLMHEVKTII